MDKGAQLEATTINGATPFMRAIESSKPEVVQFLIEKGAKLQIENKKGKSLSLSFRKIKMVTWCKLHFKFKC